MREKEKKKTERKRGREREGGKEIKQLTIKITCIQSNHMILLKRILESLISI